MSTLHENFVHLYCKLKKTPENYEVMEKLHHHWVILHSTPIPGCFFHIDNYPKMTPHLKPFRLTLFFIREGPSVQMGISIRQFCGVHSIAATANRSGCFLDVWKGRTPFLLQHFRDDCRGRWISAPKITTMLFLDQTRS